jgi:entericidin B
MKIFAKFLMIALIAASFAACNTISGAGKDIKAGGKAIEDTADDAKK